MKKYFILIIAVAVFCAMALPVCAETVFNGMSKCVKSWGKGCCAGTGANTAAPAKDKKRCYKTDALGNKVSCMTDNSGQTRLGH